MSRAQLTETEAATFVPPLLLSPASLLDDELAWLVSELDDGSEPSVLPVVFGLLPTWSLDWPSALLAGWSEVLELDSPAELEVESASVVWEVVAPIVSEPAVRLWFRSATVFVSMTFTATAAPIATFLPPADAFEFRFDSRSSLAVIDAAPVNFAVAPEVFVPRWALVWSLTMSSETDGEIATPPSEPALSSVSTTWREAAEMVRAPQLATAQE